MSSSLEIKYEMKAFDRKDRAYYDNFTDEDRKKFSTYLMLKYGANVSGNSDYQEWYLRATNERVNINFFDINRHTKLQWLCCTTVSPGMGEQFHYWLNAKKKDSGNNKIQKFLTKLYPDKKQDEIELLSRINDKRDIEQLAKELGYDDKFIKSEL
jgi:hypothetical protein